ncbi:MAG: transcriptional repressor [Desulfurobacteriaceae bacterium]
MEIVEKIENFKKKAKLVGLKITPQRIAVYREIVSRNDHPCAEELFESLKGKIEGISLTTVYRTLASLEKAGLVVRVPTLKDKIHYDAKVEPHSHFVCVKCGKIYDVELDLKLDTTSLEREGFSIVSYSVLYHGICKECKEKNEEV